MFKRLLTGCLTIALATVSIPAMAVDTSVKIGGRALFEILKQSKTINEGDTVNTTDERSEGRLDLNLKAVEGSWTVKGRYIARGRTNDNFYAYQKYVSVENDSFRVRMGRQGWALWDNAPQMGGKSTNRYCYGCGYEPYQFVSGGPNSSNIGDINNNEYDDRVVLTLKDIGSGSLYAMHSISEDVDVTGYTSTSYGLKYFGGMGPLFGSVSYTFRGLDANVENGGTEDSTYDGTSYSNMNAVIKVPLSDKMYLDFGLEFVTAKTAEDDAAVENFTTYGIGYVMSVTDSIDLMLAYDTTSYTTDRDNDDSAQVDNLITFHVIKTIAGQKLILGYNSEKITDGDFDETILDLTKISLAFKVEM